MEIIKNLFQKIKNQPDLWIFYAFILVLPFTIRKVLFFYPLGLVDQKTFNEYSGIYLYLSDIFIILLVFFWIVPKLYNKGLFLSNNNKLSPKKLWIRCVKRVNKVNLLRIFSNVPRGTLIFVKKLPIFIKKATIWNIWKNKLIFIPLLLVTWSFISIFWSESHSIALFRSIKLLEFFLLYLFIKERLLKIPSSTLAPLSSNVPRGTFEDFTGWNIKKNILRIFMFWGSIQSIIAIWQFISQKSIGLTILKESIISPETLGVAKIIINGEKYIRSYGLFPHPNILGGFLLLTIISTYLYKKLFHVEQFNSITITQSISADIQIAKIYLNKVKKAILSSKKIHKIKMFHPPRLVETTRRREAGVEHWRRLKNRLSKIVQRLSADEAGGTIQRIIRNIRMGITSLTSSKSFKKSLNYLNNNFLTTFLKENTSWLNILLLLETIGLLLTFSKSAIIGLLIAIIYIFINASQNDNVPRGTLKKNKQMFHVEQIKKLKYYFLLSFVIFGILLFYFKIDLYALFIQSLEERFIYLTASIQAIIQNMLWGLGNGQFVLEMGSYSLQNLAFWQYQPVHNVFLLILSELGMIGLFLFIWFLLEIFKPVSQNVPRGTFKAIARWNTYLKSILLGFIFIMIFDHYLWDIQQGSLMLWLVIGLISVKE